MPVVPGPTINASDSESPSVTRPGNYPYRIPSIHEKNPTLPPVLSHINISKSIAKRDVLNRQDLLDARAIASAFGPWKENELEAASRINLYTNWSSDLNLFQYEGLTEEVVESAERRAEVIGLVRELIYTLTHLLHSFHLFISFIHFIYFQMPRANMYQLPY